MNFMTASVDIKVDDDKLKSQLAKARSAVTKTVDRIKASFKKMGASFKAVFSKMVHYGKWAGLAIAGVFLLVTRAAMKQEDVIKRLNITLKATGYAAGFTAQQLLEQAAALQKVTRFGDETIIAMQTMLLTFKNIKGDEFERATEAALDMATAEAAVSGRAVDLTAVSIRLGKALNDPILGLTALARVGVDFTEVQKSMIKQMVMAGNVAGAQAVILKELEGEFGGMSRDVDTASGALRQMWNVLGDVAEKIGAAFIPGIKDSAIAIKEWAEQNEEKIGQWAKEIVHYVGLVKNAFVDWLRYLQQDWKTGINVALQTILKLLEGFWKSSVMIMQTAGKAAGRAFVSAFGEPIVQFADEWLAADFWERLIDPAGSAMYALVSGMAEIIKEANKKIGKDTIEETKTVGMELKQIWKTIWADIENIMSEVPKKEQQAVKETVKTIKEQYADALRAKIAMINEEIAKIEEASNLARKLAEEDKEIIVAAARDYIMFIRDQDYMTREQRIQNLQAYVVANQEALDKVKEANKILTDELKNLEEEKFASLERAATEARNIWERFSDVAVNSIDSLSNALADMVLTGKADFKSLAQSILTDLTRMIIKQQIYNALGIGGGGGIIGGVTSLLGLGGEGGGGGGGGWDPGPTSGTVLQTVTAPVHKGGVTVVLNDQRSGSTEKLEVSQAEEYMISDERIIQVSIQAAQRNRPYRRSHRMA